MKGLDTNVLVRYITQDDPRQSLIADEAIENIINSGKRCIIQPIVLCELVWVLESAYGYAKSEILMVLNQLLRTMQFDIADKDIVWQAFSDFQKGKADFSDYLIGRANEKKGADSTLTFDRSLQDSPRFQVLK